MCFASMWLGMLFEGPSFPHTLQIASLFRPSLLRTFARVIMDLICSSRSAGSALIGVFEIATISTGFVVDACSMSVPICLNLFSFSKIRFHRSICNIVSFILSLATRVLIGSIETFQFEFFSKWQKRFQVILEDICLAKIEELNNGQEGFRKPLM